MTKKKSKYSHTQKEKNKDKCPVCDVNLYYDKFTTKRIGIMDMDGDVHEWKCPFCKSEFDLNDNILYIYGPESDSGLA